jgi:hypothetical protein
MRPLQRGVTRPGTGKPNGHSERCGVNPTSPREEGKPYLERSPLGSAHTGLPQQRCGGTVVEKSAKGVLCAEQRVVQEG